MNKNSNLNNNARSIDLSFNILQKENRQPQTTFLSKSSLASTKSPFGSPVKSATNNNSPKNTSKPLGERNLNIQSNEQCLSPKKRKISIEKNVVVPISLKKACHEQKTEETIRKENLEYLEGLQADPVIPGLYCDFNTDCEYFVRKIEYNEYKEIVLLNRVYSALGVQMPPYKHLVMPKGTHYLLVENVKGTKPSQYLKNATGQQKQHFYQELRKSFACDVLFRNMRVLEGDIDSSYVVDSKGDVWRSSALNLKVSNENQAYPVEIWDARDKTKNTLGHMIWSTLSILDIANQITTLIKLSDAFFYGFSKKDKTIADKRLSNLLIFANKTRSMTNDGWHIPYIDNINKHIVYLKKEGCESRLPTQLHPTEKAGVLIGPNDYYFEGLRGSNSVVEKVLMPYVNANNGNYKFIIDWMVGHESSGWSVMSQILMHFLTLHRKAPISGHFWKEGELMAKLHYAERAGIEGNGDSIKGAKIIENSFIILHAFTQIVLGRIEFPNNNLRKDNEGTVKFLRSENIHVMRSYSRVFANNINMQVGVYSSGSVVTNPPLVHGTEITERIIPHHRVIALYFMLRTLAEKNRGAFSNDLQNEFTAILGGINCNYIGTLSKI